MPGTSASLVHDDDVIDDEVIDVVNALATRVARFDVQHVACRSQLVVAVLSAGCCHSMHLSQGLLVALQTRRLH